LSLTRWALQELHYGALMRLCLSDNALGAQGAADLAALISDCVPGLESLRLAHNGIGDAGAVHIAGLIRCVLFPWEHNAM
jgi:Ran GTPase-activating protein (RanGAP) involved in mRNA processing and transport